MHVLVVSAWNPRSGVLTVYRSLAKHLAPRGVRFSAYGFDGWDGDTWWTFCDELVDGRSTTLAETLVSGKYDLLHCLDGVYSSPYGVETWVRRARFTGPVILMAQVARRLLSEPAHATKYVACSRAAADVLRQDADGPVVVIANGYDEDVFRPGGAEDPGRPLLVWVGRSYDPQKDIQLFLDVMERLPAYDALIVDDNPDPLMRNRLGHLSPQVRHQVLISPSEVATAYWTAASSGGALVSTSRWEGFPLAVVEAMACGCPVVAPAIPGHEHLVDGRNAVVYDRTAGAIGVTEAVERLRDPAVRRSVTVQAQDQARERWTSRAMANAYLELYEEAIVEKPGPLSKRIPDRAIRLAWHAAIAGRPAWHKVRRLVRG